MLRRKGSGLVGHPRAKTTSTSAHDAADAAGGDKDGLSNADIAKPATMTNRLMTGIPTHRL